MEQYYTIGEAATLLNVTTKTLRTWDKEKLFIPDLILDNANRRYSRNQIEAKTGKTIEMLKDPVLTITEKQIRETTLSLEEVNIKLDKEIFIREKSQIIIEYLSQQTHVIRRQNKTIVPNFILASPEICSFIENTTIGFAPAIGCYDENIDSNVKVGFAGTLNRRWKLYFSYMMPVSAMFLGTISDGKMHLDENYATRFWIENIN